MNNHLDRTLSVLLTIFCLVSCVDQMHAPETDSPEVLTSYTACMEGTDVKSVLDGNVSLWKGQEDIHVIGKSGSAKFSASVDGQSQSATFNYAGSGSWNEKEVLAIYPYGAGNHSGDLGVELDKIYRIVVASFIACGGDAYGGLTAPDDATFIAPLECPGVFYFGCTDIDGTINFIKSELGGVIGEEYAQPQGRITIIQ